MSRRKKKKNKSSEEDALRRHTENQILRRNAKLKKEAEKQEKKRNDLFRRRVQDASEKKVLKTVRTKAYYRFAKEYPSTVDQNGFRENSERKKKLTPRKKIILAICCILVFMLSFTLIKTGMKLSEKEIPTEPAPESETNFIRGLHIPSDMFARGDIAEIKTLLESRGCNTAVIDVKDESGYVYFDVNNFIGGSADKKIPAAWDTVSALQAEGIKTCAYISCFKDISAASAEPGFELRSTSTDGSVFYDENMYSWLNPMNENAATYVLDIIDRCYNGGFGYIILDNVCFPLSHQTDIPAYTTEEEIAANRNTALLNFTEDAAGIVGKEKLIFMGDISAFTASSDTPNEKYGGAMLGASCAGFAADLRKNRQCPQLMPDSDLFKYIEDMPEVFILDAGKTTFEKTEEINGIPLAVVDASVDSADESAGYAGYKNIILW